MAEMSDFCCLHKEVSCIDYSFGWVLRYYEYRCAYCHKVLHYEAANIESEPAVEEMNRKLGDNIFKEWLRC